MAHKKGPKPDPESAFGRLKAWFADPLNRHEMLSADDVAAREDLTPDQARFVLYRLKSEGVIEGAYVYRKKAAAT